ncbi:GNAT family N-acetyltransferase [Streptomyces sp. NPDC021020]|uniref:GNAT family N-acetyltransferase n=1 Tax=Streptomyces sp. NPDC021020 TaxID=3365109 RepID=UPI0037B2CEC8
MPAAPRAAALPGVGAEAPLVVSVCRESGEFGRLAEEWGGLWRRCAGVTGFQGHGWLHSWWLAYGGRRDRLRVVLVRRAGVLVGAAPLMRTYRPWPVVVALGGGITDYTDVLVAADGVAGTTPDAVARALAEGIRAVARGAVVDLREVRPGAAAFAVYDAWRGPKRRAAGSVCLELPGLPMEELIARVGSSRGQRIRANLRKLDDAGVTVREAAAHEAPDAVAGLLRLHRAQWQGRGVTPEHLRPRFALHLTRAAGAMVASGEAAVAEFHVGGRVVAANLTVLSPALAGGYLYGADPALRGTKVDVMTLLMRHGVGHAAGAGRPVLSLLRGAEPHKFHWRPEHVANERLLLASRPLGPLLHTRYALALARTRLAGTAAARLPALRACRARLNDLLSRRPARS